MNPPDGIGGAGFPRPPVANIQLPPGSARGVDLRKVKYKSTHQHRWILVANFTVVDKIMADLATTKDAIRLAASRGEEWVGENVELPVTQEALLLIDGPGCAKCGLHWEHEGGYGQLCDVDDADFDPTVATTPGPGQPNIAQAMANKAAMAKEIPDGVAPEGLMTVEEAVAQADEDDAAERRAGMHVVGDPERDQAADEDDQRTREANASYREHEIAAGRPDPGEGDAS